MIDKKSILSLDYDIIKCTSSIQKHKIQNIKSKKNHKKTYWSVGTGVNHEIIIKFKQPVLLGYIDLYNRSTSRIEIFVSMEHYSNTNYIEAISCTQLLHNKRRKLDILFLPCQYVKLRLKAGNPISLYSVLAYGIPFDTAQYKLGTTITNLIIRRPLQSKCFSKVHGVRSDRIDKPSYPLNQHYEIINEKRFWSRRMLQEFEGEQGTENAFLLGFGDKRKYRKAQRSQYIGSTNSNTLEDDNYDYSKTHIIGNPEDMSGKIYKKKYK